jgi:chemotaxis protein CheY-P-specific phosphatase CheC
MSSKKSLTTNLPKLIDPESTAAMFAALRRVAEESFFAVAELRDDASFTALAATVPRWLIATVRFEEGPLVGSMSCALPVDLAHALFDAFTGRDPADPAPAIDQVQDLVGEFSNMVCGVWLTQVASRQMFTLSHPVVESAPAIGEPGGLRLLVAIDDLPVAVDLCVQPVPQSDTTLTQA